MPGQAPAPERHEHRQQQRAPRPGADDERHPRDRDEHQPPRDVDDADLAEPPGHERRHGHRGRGGGQGCREDGEEGVGHQRAGSPRAVRPAGVRRRGGVPAAGAGRGGELADRGDEVTAQDAHADLLEDAGGRSTPGEPHGVVLREAPQLRAVRAEAGGAAAREHHGIRVGQPRRGRQRVDGGVGAEVADPPPGAAEQHAEAEQDDVVELARGTGEHGHRAGADPPRERQRPEASPHEAAREVLLGDADPAELPHLADADEEGEQDVDDGALDRALEEGGVEDGVGAVLVEGGDGVEQLGDEHLRCRRAGSRGRGRCLRRMPRRRRRAGAARRAPAAAAQRRVVVRRVDGLALQRGRAGPLGRQHPPGGLDGADPLVAQADDLAHPSLVLAAVEPVAAGGPHGAQEAVAALPGTQHVGAHAHLGGELTNPHRRRDRTPHVTHRRPLGIRLTNI